MRAAALALVAVVASGVVAPGVAALSPRELATLVVPEPPAPAPRTPVADIRKLLRPEASILQARSRLDQDIERRGHELARARALEATLAADLAERTRHADALTAELERSRAAVSLRVGAMALLARTPCATRTLGRATWAEAERACQAADRVALADYGRLFGYTLQLQRWRVVQSDVARRGDNLERTRRRIGYLEQELAWDREEKTALQTAVVKEPEFYAAYAQEMERLDPEIAERIEVLLAGAPKDRPRLYIAETRGGLSSPIKNPEIVGGFGQRSMLGHRSGWRGLHLAPARAPREGERTDVRAIYWGWVAWTGWIVGLGKVVILDHTMGYASIYAHLDAIDVKVGDKVATGTTLGAMGATESFFGPRLYLELRKDGVALDPLPWFKS
ncbi:MAG: peptidoglycan DD-metalloendopeptidase family protein [Deltaproteobacteria bacterium]|nr:peptidoglycan DD-metalloendopeptidase family protein [Deltaproteobacteria bacterium]